MKTIKANYLLFLVFALLGCKEKYRLNVGTFPSEQPTNLIDLNSPYDEMNSDFVSPFLSAEVTLVFSSNATTKGENFDLDARSLNFNQSKETGQFTFTVSQIMGQNEVLRNQLFEINSDCEERGPNSIGTSAGVFYQLFSRDCDGTSHIFYNEFEKTGPFAYRSENFQVRLANENSSEMYPTFYGVNFQKGQEGVGQGAPQKMLFSSNRDGVFDIYEADIPSGKGMPEFLKDPSQKTVKKLNLNTSSNDHMPFVYGDLLVFSSDRPGGFGGYDLYYSQKTADGWTDPVNFGPKINSEFDEYRPVVSDHPEFANRLMIFSSNRPGGLGGFDLYFVGIEKF
jgi:hypothetical protein